MKNEVLKTVIGTVLKAHGEEFGSIDDVQFCVKEELVNSYMYSETEASEIVESEEFLELVEEIGNELGL